MADLAGLSGVDLCRVIILSLKTKCENIWHGRAPFHLFVARRSHLANLFHDELLTLHLLFFVVLCLFAQLTDFNFTFALLFARVLVQDLVTALVNSQMMVVHLT